jgi:serine/threonine-protein kinase
MSSIISDRRSASGPEPSREEVRRQFLEACAASGDGPPPDLESFVAVFKEPERSSLREELESLRRSRRPASATRSELVGDTREPDPGGTVDDVPDPRGTVDYPAARRSTPDLQIDQPADGAGTVDHAPAPGGTVNDPAPDATTDHAASRRRSKGAKDLPLPQSVAGYEVMSVLGRGAMGVVYKARQRGLDRIVALKMILSGEHASEMDLNRFRAEANAVAQFQHPGIVQIYEVGEDNGRPFFSLEFVDGQSLHSKVQGTPLPPREAAELLKKMAEAMAYAHERGIIHRDLKPANVLLTSAGEPKIGDFGLAKRIQDDESGMTRTGTVLGTPSYMSPEQAEGRIKDIGPLADVYSLGAVLYDMLTGRPPFRGTSMLDTLEQLRTREPVPPMQFQPGVPRDLETICLKCLQKDPAKRYASAKELAADVGRFLRGEPILARPVSVAERAWRWCRRNPGKALTAAAFAAGIVIYAVSASVFAGVYKAQKEEAISARKTAEEQEAEAKKQKGIAEKESAIAKENERIQQRIAFYSLEGMADISRDVHNLLQSKRLALADNPEMRKLRANAVADLHRRLIAVNKRLRNDAATRNADLAAGQIIGDMLMTFGQVKDAREVYEAAYQTAVQSAEREPERDILRANLGVMEARLGDVDLEQFGGVRSAYNHYHKARDLREEIRQRPRSGDYPEAEIKRLIAQDDVRLGRVLLAMGQPATAKKYLEEAVDIRKQALATDDKKSGLARNMVAEAELWLGIASWHLRDLGATHDHFTRAVALQEELVQQYKDFADYHHDLADIYGSFGDAVLRLGDVADAQKKYQLAMRAMEAALALEPDNIAHQPLLADLHERLGIVCTLLDKEEAAKPHYADASKLRGELWQIDKSVLSRQIGFVVAMGRAGDRPNAMRLLEDTLRKRMIDSKSPDLMLQVARGYAICSADPKLDRKRNIAQALATLEEATKDDYRDVVVLQTDPDLAVLRDEPAFKELVARIQSR